MSNPAAALLATVAVPTRDRPASLARCLRALSRQTVLASTEILVCDDGSRNRQAVAEAVQATLPVARLLRLEGRGPAAARNAAIGSASAPIVCFTDDDCEPAVDWVERLLAGTADGADAIGGRTVTARPNDPLAVAAQAIADSLVRARPDDPAAISFAPTSNLAARRVVLEEVRFDEGYRFAGGEDRDWCARLAKRGYRLVHDPEAIVLHRQDLTLERFVRQQFRYGRGAYRFHRGHPDAGRGELGPLVRKGFGLGLGPGLLVCAAQVATAAGMASEAIAGGATARATARRP